MPTSIFVNLPVTNLPASRAFYSALGFSFNEQFSDDSAACLVISDTIYAMLLTHTAMQRFTRLPIADPKTSVAHLIALSRDDRAGVDAIADAALAAGGAIARPPEDHGFMYIRAFTDPDGHIWEPMWMDPAAVNPPA